MSGDDDATTLDPRARTVLVPALDLVVVEGAPRGARLAVRQKPMRIGTAEGNELRVADPLVSRLHAEVAIEGQLVRIVDQASTNGTFVDGVRVIDAFLAPGQLVRVGSTVLRAESSDAPLEVPLSELRELGGLIGASAAMRRVYGMASAIARSTTTVLVQGETGTGKELLARAIHDLSARRGPFVPVDCGAIPESLAESELFGHTRGAFTGASSARRGVFEEAQGGTLFLDEIGEISPHVQRKLLRVLEERQVRQVGASTARAVDVRVIAATNRPLGQAVNEGLFREDLFYRLAVVVIELPPLRKRREDIAQLARHFHERFSGEKQALPPTLLATVMGRSWSGNVRELRNFVERSVALGETGSGGAPPPASLDGIEAFVPVELPFKEAREAWVDRFEEAYVRAVLARSGGNVSRAARDAGMSRRFLQRVMVRLGMRDDDDE